MITHGGPARAESSGPLGIGSSGDYVSRPARIDDLEDAVRRWVMFVDGEPLAA